MIRLCIKKLTSLASQRPLQIICGVLAVMLVVISTTHTAHAMSLLNFNLAQTITDALANVFYTLQTIASWLIYLAGSLLNLTINLTMHIKEFTAATPAIYTVWKAIRDIAGMFIIFSLLYAAIMLITSYEKPNYGTLIKNIVVAGVLINFSFFITGLAIDVSNIVSLQLYNAIAPQQTLDGSLDLKKFINISNADGGLSTIFMQSLGVTRLFNPDGGASTAVQKSDGSWTEPVKIILIGVTSIIIMITAAISFFIAALTFLVRFIILLFLLAFSPILFASFVVPEIGKYADMWKKTLKGQLIFMPVYLLLMYFALSVLTSSSIFKDGYAGHLTPSGNFMQDIMVLAVNAVLVIVMLNVPLLGALSVGAIAPKWAKGMGADAIWKGFSGIAGRNTAGRLASYTDKRLANTRFGNSSLVRDLRSSTTGALAKSGFGSSRSYEDQAKIKEDVAKQRRLIEGGNTEMDKARKAKDRTERLDTLLDAGSTAPDLYKDVIKGMSEKERLALGPEKLKNVEVLKHLKKSDFEAIKKSDDISDEDKAEIGRLRMEALRQTVDRGAAHSAETEHMIKNMETDDIMKLEDSYLTDQNLVKHLTAGQLKKMADEKLSTAVKGQIGDMITGWATSPTTATISGGELHHALGFITKNRAQWS